MNKLSELIEWARGYVAENPRTPEQIRESIISFAYGNVKIHNSAITREMVEREYDHTQKPIKLAGQNSRKRTD